MSFVSRKIGSEEDLLMCILGALNPYEMQRSGGTREQERRVTLRMEKRTCQNNTCEISFCLRWSALSGREIMALIIAFVDTLWLSCEGKILLDTQVGPSLRILPCVCGCEASGKTYRGRWNESLHGAL